jgi:hypothetical protein
MDTLKLGIRSISSTFPWWEGQAIFKKMKTPALAGISGRKWLERLANAGVLFFREIESLFVLALRLNAALFGCTAPGPMSPHQQSSS